jgi:purine catabolism regulator
VARLATFPQEVVFWENLGGMKLLSMVSQSQEAETFCQSILRDLIEYDKSTNGELLQTLRVLNKNNWNVKHASEVMKFHYNTIKYRNKKICELLNFNPDNSDQRFDIALALKLYDLGSFNE